jgi:uncharacterized protein (UPF0335 family)
MEGAGMSKTKPATVAGQRIKSFVDRIERLEEERKSIGGDIRDIYAEAKGTGYDVKTIRWLVQERKVDSAARDERDSLRDVYAGALGMAVSLVQVDGLSLREASRQSGVSKSSIHRALSVPQVSQNAAPEGRVDGPSVVTVPTETIVPPSQTPQTDGVATASVTPVPDEGVGAGTSDEQEAVETGSVTVVTTGNLDALSPVLARPPDACSTGEDKCLSGRVPRSDEHSKPRSPALDASDSTEPVEPTGNEGWVGERGTEAEIAERATNGAVGSPEGDRVARNPNLFQRLTGSFDPGPIPPRLDRRVVAPPKTAPQLDEREKAAAQ